MIKHIFSFILSTIILININAFSMDQEKPLGEETKTLRQDPITKSYDDKMYDDEVPLLTKPQFAALIFFKIFIQAPIEIIDGSMKMAPILIKPTVSFSVDSANSIREFIEVVYFLYNSDSVLEEFYSIKKET